MRAERRLLQACAILVSILSHQAVHAQAGAPELRRLEVGTHGRVYTVEALGGPARGVARPIIVELHGTGTDVRDNGKTRYLPNFATVNDIEPVLIVRPQGANRVWDLLPGKLDDWRRLSGTDGVQVDDIAFLRAVIADVAARDGGDPKRAFLYGISAGGHMTHRVACEMIGEFRAIAALIASALVIQLEECKDAAPVPYLLLASKTDPVIPYKGLALGVRDSRAGAEEIIASFVHRNGCRKQDVRTVPRADPNGQMTATIIRHTDCTAGADVWFYSLEGSNHTLPSRVRYVSDGDDRINRDLETAQELWSFFKRYMD